MLSLLCLFSCCLCLLSSLIAVIDVKFEESEYSINEQAVDNQYVALRVCLRLTVTDNGLIPDTDTFTVTIATRGGTAIGKSLYSSLWLIK
jgi:hypothetical protein